MESVVASRVWIRDDCLVSWRRFPLSAHVRVVLSVFEGRLFAAARLRVE